MSESHSISEFLTPEIKSELEITRRMLAAVPDGHNDFKPADKSMTLARLAGHVAEIPWFVTATLNGPNFDLAAPNDLERHVFQTSAQNVAAFDGMAAKAEAAVRSSGDANFSEPWSLVFGEHVIFTGTRHSSYRAMAMSHLIHHRAQLGVYLRLLGVPVPKTYGPSADEQ